MSNLDKNNPIANLNRKLWRVRKVRGVLSRICKNKDIKTDGFYSTAAAWMEGIKRCCLNRNKGTNRFLKKLGSIRILSNDYHSSFGELGEITNLNNKTFKKSYNFLNILLKIVLILTIILMVLEM